MGRIPASEGVARDMLARMRENVSFRSGPGDAGGFCGVDVLVGRQGTLFTRKLWRQSGYSGQSHFASFPHMWLLETKSEREHTTVFYCTVHVCMTRKGWASIPGTGWSPRWHGPKPGYLRRVKFTVVMALRRCDRPLRALVAESARFCEAGRALSDSRMLSPTTGAGPGFFAANRPVRRWSKFARPLEPCGAANVLYVRTRYITYVWCTLIVAGLLLPRSSPYCSGCTRGYICVEDHSRSE